MITKTLIVLGSSVLTLIGGFIWGSSDNAHGENLEQLHLIRRMLFKQVARTI